ncbi:uracil-DNA glycosylase, partial [Nocardia farcinica]|uniref:uracil-DNA glycosylase n=1 Tax=Nocardia farcinica TaxID=37329 RepID=UPI002456B92A
PPLAGLLPRGGGGAAAGAPANAHTGAETPATATAEPEATAKPEAAAETAGPAPQPDAGEPAGTSAPAESAQVPDAPEIAAPAPRSDVEAPRDEAESTAAKANSSLVPRRLADPEYREQQYANRYEGPVAAINRLVDELVEESGEWMPYVAPVLGGTNARLLTLFRDPGPKTRVDKGSGMLSPENDDQSAERFLTFFEESGLAAGELMTWNTYPWYLNRKPSAAEVDRGLEPLARVIALLPELAVVMAHGLDAQNAWRRFERRYPEVAGRLLVIPTYHTSKQALFTPDPQVRAQREEKLRADFARAASYLAG